MALPSIMSIFSSKPAEPAAPVAAPNAAASNPLVPGAANPVSDGTGPVAIPKAGEGEASPLAGFADLWQKNEKDGSLPSLSVSLKIDPAKIAASAKQVDFSKSVSQVAKDAAAKGDYTQMMNEVGQAAMANGITVAAKMLDGALEAQAAKFTNEVMPEVLRRHSISTQLATDNPLFDNPAVKPMLSAIEQQMAVKYPTMGAAEVTAKAKEYLTGFAGAIVGANGQKIVPAEVKDTSSTANKQARGEYDWQTFLEGPTQ